MAHETGAMQAQTAIKADRAFGHARQILHFMRNSQVVEPELKRVHEELNPTPKEHKQATTGEAVEMPSGEKPQDEKPPVEKPPDEEGGGHAGTDAES